MCPELVVLWFFHVHSVLAIETAEPSKRSEATRFSGYLRQASHEQPLKNGALQVSNVHMPVSPHMQKHYDSFLEQSKGQLLHGNKQALRLLAETMHRFLLNEDQGAGDPNGVEAKMLIRRVSSDLMQLSEKSSDDINNAGTSGSSRQEVQKLQQRLDEEQAIDEQVTSSFNSAATSVQSLLRQVESYKATLALARRTPGGLRAIELEKEVHRLQQVMDERDRRLDLAAAETRNLSAVVQSSQAETAAVAHELLQHKEMVKKLRKEKKTILAALQRVRTGQHVKQLEQRSRAQQRVIGTMQDEFEAERTRAKRECQADKDSLSDSLGEMREEAEHLSKQVAPLEGENKKLKEKIKQLERQDAALSSDKENLVETLRAKFLQSQTTVTTTKASVPTPLSLLNLVDSKSLESLQLMEFCQAAGRQAEDKAQSEVEEAEAEAQAETEPEQVRRLKDQMQLLQRKLHAEKQRSASAHAALQKLQDQMAESAKDFRAVQEQQQQAAEEQQRGLVSALAEKDAEEASLKEQAEQRSALLQNQAMQIQGDPEALAALEADQKNQEEAEAEAIAEADETAREASGVVSPSLASASTNGGSTGFVEVAKSTHTVAASQKKHILHHQSLQQREEKPEAAAEELMRRAQMVFS
eukprot:gnl/MRDRNA2_/MRDRNA2_111406_c0_seq1.p1 gnl/MRDRNA2_/MRDRNA2_111406_c0~~gnl/MRDRNA2_/MRDRNA2_111406_c0_seq1.p1  ORF type:complete len:641 (+),score=202.86 gnl/MRDRNA2_/MRDRNA2_111406_c0_seq1:113-2035(+)